MTRVSATGEVRDLRGDIRHWRRGRVDTKITEALGDAYVTVFATLLLGSMVVSVIVNLRLVSDELCTAGGCQEARTALPWLVGLSALAVVLTLARLFGPVFVSPAVGSWLLSAPVDRAALLRPRLLWTAAIAAVFSRALRRRRQHAGRLRDRPAAGVLRLHRPAGAGRRLPGGAVAGRRPGSPRVC